jgi:hypothetical protein
LLLFAAKFRIVIRKIFKVAWTVSLLAMVVVFIYSYASWPEEVSLGEGGKDFGIDRNTLFYVCLLLVGVFNALVFVVTRMNFSEAFGTWFYGLVISFHIFFITASIFITILNSSEKYDYSMIGPTVYVSIGLLLISIIAWPVYLVVGKYFVAESPQS